MKKFVFYVYAIITSIPINTAWIIVKLHYGLYDWWSNLIPFFIGFIWVWVCMWIGVYSKSNIILLSKVNIVDGKLEDYMTNSFLINSEIDINESEDEE